MLSREIDKTCAVERISVPALDEILGWAFPILDYGFLRVIDYLGDDSAICQSARVSYGTGTKKLNEDRGLIRYMLKHQHGTPFEMCEIKFHIKLPIFVARQFIRHRISSYNEYSARYSILDKEFYIPEPEHLAAQSTINRQGRGDVLEGEEANTVLNILREDSSRNYDHYLLMLNEGEDADMERAGLARELARMNLTLNTYTQWYWKTNLRSLFNFLNLRADSHAQYEIRVYAEEMQKIVHQWVPIAAEAFVDYVQEAKTLSRMEIAYLRDLLKELHERQGGSGYATAPDKRGMSMRELNEFGEFLKWK